MSDALLTVSNLETYYGPIMAIRGVSFSVPKGKIVTILGANGAGKTTILKTVSGVMDPQKGTVALEGREIQGMDPDKVTRLGLTHVPEGREVFPFLTVHENLRMGAFTRNDAGDIARDLETVYDYFPVLRARAGQRAGSLSGGEQQMLSISRALMARPAMIMLDEPTAGVNPALTQSLLRHIQQLRDEGMTILFVEHDMDVVMGISDWVVCMAEGRVIAEGPPASIGSNHAVIDAYLGAHHGRRGGGEG